MFILNNFRARCESGAFQIELVIKNIKDMSKIIYPKTKRLKIDSKEFINYPVSINRIGLIVDSSELIHDNKEVFTIYFGITTWYFKCEVEKDMCYDNILKLYGKQV